MDFPYNKNFAAFIAGVIFSLGLGLAHMTQPAKILAFLDVAGAWDPSLIFVMIGAIPVTFLFYRFAGRRSVPVPAAGCAAPTAARIDRRLLGGAALFGVGWGLAGYCPGPAVTSLVTLQPGVFILVAGMIAGMYAYRLLAALGQPVPGGSPEEATEG